jgi:hypothetical protein
MDPTMAGVAFAVVAVVATVARFVYMRRGVRSLQRGADVLGDIRDQLARRNEADIDGADPDLQRLREGQDFDRVLLAEIARKATSSDEPKSP